VGEPRSENRLGTVDVYATVLTGREPSKREIESMLSARTIDVAPAGEVHPAGPFVAPPPMKSLTGASRRSCRGACRLAVHLENFSRSDDEAALDLSSPWFRRLRERGRGRTREDDTAANAKSCSFSRPSALASCLGQLYVEVGSRRR
jgi:hypothetical protein